MAKQNHYTKEEDRLEFLKTLPRKRMSAAGLIFDSTGRILLVKPSYADVWHLPGGCVESLESPMRGACREIKEETGLTLEPARLLTVDCKPGAHAQEEALVFIFDFGEIDQQKADLIRVDGDEIREHGFYPVEKAADMVTEPMGRRIIRSIASRKDGKARYLEDTVDPFENSAR